MEIRIYKIPPEKLANVKAILEAPETEKPNPFKRNGYILREGKSLGLGEEYYLYLSALPEFFEKNEHILLENGVIKLEGGEFEKVKEIIEREQENAAVGLGSIFG